MGLNCLMVPFVPADAGTQTWQRLSASRVEDARERAYGPLDPRFRGDERRLVQSRGEPKFIPA
jgi:hypothetical protein